MGCRYLLTIMGHEICGCKFNNNNLKECKKGCIFNLSSRMLELNEKSKECLDIIVSINKDWDDNLIRFELALIAINNISKYVIEEAMKEEVY